MKVLIIGAVFLVGTAAYLLYELRRAPLIEDPGRAAIDHAIRTVPEQTLAANDAQVENDLQDWLWSDVIMSGRDDPAPTLALGDPSFPDQIDDWVHAWSVKYGKGDR